MSLSDVSTFRLFHSRALLAACLLLFLLQAIGVAKDSSPTGFGQLRPTPMDNIPTQIARGGNSPPASLFFTCFPDISPWSLLFP